MTESSYYNEESYEFSFEDRQKDIRRIIISLRIKNNLSVARLAQRIGLSTDELNEYELGNKKISLWIFSKIMETCGCFDYNLDDKSF